MEKQEHTIQDSTESFGGGRIPESTCFKTVWHKSIKLLQYFKSNRGSTEFSIQDLNKLSRQDKLAISRHKKVLMKKLDLTKESKKVKIIYLSTCPTNFFTDFAVEKEKIFQTDMSRLDKNYCVLWTKEKEELIKQYEELEKRSDKELEKIENKIMKRP